MSDTRDLKPGHCHKCGLELSDNAHPEAGKPSHYLDVGCPKECIPCLTKSRHSWANRAMKAEGELRDHEQAALATTSAEPIYQIASADGRWNDVGSARYEDMRAKYPDAARIVYAAPSLA